MKFDSFDGRRAPPPGSATGHTGVEPGLQHHRGRHLVDNAPPLRPLHLLLHKAPFRDDRGQPFIVGNNRHGQETPKTVSLGAGRPGGRTLRSVK